METKWESIYIPNTWKDLVEVQTTRLDVTDEEGVKEVEQEHEFYDIEVNSLEDIYLGKSYSVDLKENKVEVGDNYRLSDYISKIPHGIIDKKRPGIGATTIEIKSQRNSIIVTPTKALAYNKSLKHPHCLYVGSKLNDERKKVSEDEILAYLNDENIKFKKFLVVADSLKYLIETLEKVNSDIATNYFLMVDEVDMLQSESSYRPNLEIVMDYYFKFHPLNRCLLTATMKDFSNPNLKEEARLDLTGRKPKRNINLIHTDNINGLVKQEIETLVGENKIVIAYNSILQILSIINSLSSDLQTKCAILCSGASKREAGDFFSTLTDENTLPKDINFITSTYFAGIDIEEKFHLITVSNANKFFQILCIDKMTQISGRCRIENGLLSETIVYNTPRKSAIFDDGSFQEILLSRAEKIIALYKAADNISKNDIDTTKLFSAVKKAIQHKGVYSVGGEEIELTREDIDGEFVSAYLNIDSVVEKMKLDSGYYMYPNALKNELSKLHNINVIPTDPIEITKAQKKIEKSATKTQKEYFDTDIENAKENIIFLESTGKLDDKNLERCKKFSKRAERDFYGRFIKLYRYLDTDTLLDLLSEIKNKNRTAFKTVNNTIIFWALDDNHSLKKDVSSSIEINKVYSSDELDKIMQPIIQYHFFKTLKPRVSISLLRSFYKVDRTKKSVPDPNNPSKPIVDNKYKPIGSNPKNLTVHKDRISQNENLTGLFLL